MITRTTEQILGAALERLVRETDITVTSPGSIARTWFEIAAEELGYEFRIMDANISSLFPSSAGGTALDKLGTLFGVVRTSTSTRVSANEGRVYFYLNTQSDHQRGTSDTDADADITIPAGTVLSTQQIGFGQNPISWRTTDQCIIYTDSHMAFVSVEPVVSIINTVAAGTLVNHNLDVTDYPNVYVYNRNDLEAAESFESDTNYRYRIVSAINQAARANVLALRLSGLGISGVRDCKISPLAYGIGTVKVTVVLDDASGVNASQIFADASAAVRSAASVGDVLFIQRPAETSVGITAVVNGDGINQAILDAIQGNITRYINSLSVGDSLVSAKIINEALSTSAKVKDFAIMDGGYRFNGVPKVFATVAAGDDEQFFPGTITVIAASSTPLQEQM